MHLMSESLNGTNAGAHASLLQAFGTGALDALLVSPERLANEKFVQALIGAKQGLGLFVIDEAHCISDWGHDFRPDYRRIAGLVRSFPASLPVLATTATANERVREDVRNQLGNFAIQAGSLMRDSLRLESHWLGGQAERLAWLGYYIPRFEGSGIVYVLTKADAHLVASWLQSRNVRAHAYHASVVLDEGSTGTDEDRAYIEKKFLDGEGYRVLASTVALGMGFDKPDLKFVVHFQAPASVIAYYQQAGRAGRGIPHADCVLLGGVEDERIHGYFREHAFPEVEECLTVLRALEVGFPDGAQAADLAEVVNLDESRIEWSCPVSVDG